MQDFESEIFDLPAAENGERAEGSFCNKLSCTRGIRGETACDFVLPDYMGDVKKLLKSSASVSLANKYIGGGEISFLMMITYRVTYIDSEEKLTEAVFNSDYEYNSKCREGFIDAALDTKVESLFVRLQGPRKISARASVLSNLSVCGEDKISDLCDIEGGEIKSGKIKVHKADFLSSAQREYAEEVGRIEGVSADEVEVIKSDAEAIVDSCRMNDGAVVVSGSVNAFCLLRVDDDVIRLEKTFPFEESIEYATDASYPEFYASANICSVSVNLNSEIGEDADAGVLYAAVVMNMTAECFVRCNYNIEYSLICDAFKKGMINECGYKPFSYDELKACIFEKRKITLCSDRDGTPIRSILDSDIKLGSCKAELIGSDIVVSGTAEYNIVATGMAPGECFGLKGEREFEEKIKIFDTPKDSSKLKMQIDIVPCETSVSFDGEKIYISFTLMLTGFITEDGCERVLTSLQSSEREACGRCVTVYYPKEGDTLWSIAKKYAVAPGDIERYNSEITLHDGNADINVENVARILIVDN